MDNTAKPRWANAGILARSDLTIRLRYTSPSTCLLALAVQRCNDAAVHQCASVKGALESPISHPPHHLMLHLQHHHPLTPATTATMSQPPKRPHSPTSDETLPKTRPRISGRTAFHVVSASFFTGRFYPTASCVTS